MLLFSPQLLDARLLNIDTFDLLSAAKLLRGSFPLFGEEVLQTIHMRVDVKIVRSTPVQENMLA